jgi:hypothetical protein
MHCLCNKVRISRAPIPCDQAKTKVLSLYSALLVALLVLLRLLENWLLVCVNERVHGIYFTKAKMAISMRVALLLAATLAVALGEIQDATMRKYCVCLTFLANLHLFLSNIGASGRVSLALLFVWCSCSSVDA